MVQKVQQVVKMHGKTGSLWQILVPVFTLLNLFAYAQKPEVVLSVNKKEVTKDERITFTVTSNVQGSMKIDFPTDFEVDFGVMHGMEQKMDHQGKIKTFYYMQQSGLFRKEGSFSFTASIDYQNRNYKSNKITVKVVEPSMEEFSKIRTNDPVFGLLQCKKTTVYEGEPLVIKAKVFSYVDIEYLEGYSPFKADLSMEEHAFPASRVEVEQTRVNGKDALTFEYGKQLLIPISTGKCKIRPFEMALRCQGSIFTKTIRFKSNALQIEIKPLPAGAPADFIGAVGEYQFSQKSPKKEVKVGDVITLELVLSGAGNIHNSNTPKLKLPSGCAIYGDPERVEKIDFTENGAEGTIVYRYNIQILEEKELQFQAPSVSFFHPEKEKYVTLHGKSFSIHVLEGKTAPQVLTTNETPLTPDNQNLESGGNQQPDSETTGSRSALWWIGIAAPTGLLAFLLLIFFTKRKRSDSSEPPLTNQQQALPLSDIPATSSLTSQNYWDLALEKLGQPNEFSVLFPKGIIYRVEQCENCCFQSREKAFDRLVSCYPDVAKGLREIIETCDQYRYGFGASELDTAKLVADAEFWLEKLPK